MTEKCYICKRPTPYFISRSIGGGCTTRLYGLCDEPGLEVLAWLLEKTQKVQTLESTTKSDEK